MLDPEKSLHTSRSLYVRLGGYDGIAHFVRELMPRLRDDPKLGVYWKGKSLDSRRRGDKLLLTSCAPHLRVPSNILAPT